MSKKQTFKPISADKQKQYEREARLQYGPDNVNESVRRWNSYSSAQREVIMEEGGQIYTEISERMQAGENANSADVQALLERWHQHLRYFYEPTLEILRGFGELYYVEPEFNAFFTKLHPDLPKYLKEGIEQYVDALEYAAIARLLAEDEENKAAQ